MCPRFNSGSCHHFLKFLCSACYVSFTLSENLLNKSQLYRFCTSFEVLSHQLRRVVLPPVPARNAFPRKTSGRERARSPAMKTRLITLLTMGRGVEVSRGEDRSQRIVRKRRHPVESRHGEGRVGRGFLSAMARRNTGRASS